MSGTTNCTLPYLAFSIKNNTLADGVAGNRGISIQLDGQAQGVYLNHPSVLKSRNILNELRLSSYLSMGECSNPEQA